MHSDRASVDPAPRRTERLLWNIPDRREDERAILDTTYRYGGSLVGGHDL